MKNTNFNKLLQYIKAIAKHPITIENDYLKSFDAKLTKGIVVNEIVLRPNLFYTDNCQHCGGCCIPESTKSDSESVCI